MASIVASGFGTWTARATPSATTWFGIAWSESLGIFVATSYDGIASPILTSTDGVTWVARAAGAVDNWWNNVIWVEDLGLFVTVCSVSGTATNVMTSSNGTSWTLQTAPDSGWVGLAWNGTTLLATGQSPNTDVMTSPDGVNWTSQASSGFTGSMESVAWSPTLAMFIGVVGTDIYSSTNGIAWTLRADNADTGAVQPRVVWADGLASFFVLSGSIPTDPTHGGVYASTDGISWTRNAFQQTGVADANALAWSESEGVLLVMQAGTATYLTSEDGVTWTSHTGLSKTWANAAWAEGLGMFAATNEVGGGSTEGVASTTYQALPSVTGLTHLEGEAVSVVADDVVIASPNNPAYDTITVTSGAITLPAGTYTSVTVGLPYITDIQTLDLDMPQSTSKPGKFLITSVGAWVEESLSFYAGPEEPTGDTLDLPSGGDLQPFQVLDRNENAVTTPQTGYRMLNFEGRWGQSGSVFIRNVDPTPLTVLALVPYGTYPR